MIAPIEKIVSPIVCEKLKEQSPKKREIAPNRAIFFSATLPDIWRMTPPCTSMMIEPRYTKVYPISLGVNLSISNKKKFIQNSKPEKRGSIRESSKFGKRFGSWMEGCVEPQHSKARRARYRSLHRLTIAGCVRIIPRLLPEELG